MVKVAFIQQGTYEGMGVMYLSSSLKRGKHSVKIFIENLEKNLDEELLKYNPDLLCFSTMSGSHLWVYNTVKRIKKSLPNVLSVMGGPHPTFFPESIEQEVIDLICIGEGEEAILELANAFPDKEKIKKIANFYVKDGNHIFKNEVRNLIEDLDLTPLPDREIYYRYPILKNAIRKVFITTRGCPYNCSFCFNHQYKKIYQGKGKHIRRRSAENIIKEILEVKEKYGLKSVFFGDDTFILDKAWLGDFLEKYKKQVGLPFTCLVRADLTDEDVVKWLKLANCVGVQFGIESGDELIRNKTLRKNLKDEQIIRAAKLFKRYKIKFKTYNILGLPHETLESAFKTVELNIKIKTDLPWASILIPYPKTDITDIMKEQGMIPLKYNVDDLSSTFFDKKIKTKKEKIILNLHRMFFLSVKFPKLFPLIKKLIRLPPNFIFDGIFYLSQLYIYKVSENLDWFTSIKIGYHFVKLNMFKKKS